LKRLLALAYFFPPLGGGGCQRTLKLVRYLEPQGWAVSVVTTRDSDYWIADPTLLEEVPQSAEVLRVGGWTAHRALGWLARGGIRLERAQGARRGAAFRALRALQSWALIPDGFVGWSRAARRAAAGRIRRGGVDALWTTSSPESSHLAGLALARRFGIPWVADFRDPWVGRATYRAPTPIHDRAHRSLERAVIERADRITMVSEAMIEAYQRRYPHVPASRFALLPNGYDPDDWARAREEEARAPREDEAHFVLLHAGQLAHRPTVHTLLEAARALLAEDPSLGETLRVRFLGGNEELSGEEPARLGLAGVIELRDSVDHRAALVEMHRAGALALLGHGGAGDALIYTGKIYEYLTSGRPVLAILDPGPARELLRAAGAGPVLLPGDVAGTAAALRAWIAAWRRGAGPQAAVDAGLLRGFTRQEIAARAAQILDGLRGS
jgi:glycosyltransferase involved in cell wall biosynthesis